jgi:hypothetical protein
MKAVIEGELYDTETAELIGMATADAPVTDFRHWRAGLYRTKGTGQFFLVGTGGPMTRFAQAIKNGTVAGSKIVLLDDDYAQDWAEVHLNVEIEAAFQGDYA